MSGAVIRFYFDYISPNAYLAWTQLPALAARNGCVIEPVPVLFAGLLEAHRQRGPAEVLPKMRWMWKNILRKAAVLGVPLNAPVFFPFNPLLSLRVSSLELRADERLRLVGSLFDAVWVRGMHIAEPEIIEKVATEVELDGRRLNTLAQQPACKAQLRKQTDQAIADGVFGVPTMVVGDELFWGYDDMTFLQRFLDATDPIDRAPWDPSIPLRSSATRNQTA
jgi:2-hydroxychromene-2-carboxylate isomerase